MGELKGTFAQWPRGRWPEQLLGADDHLGVDDLVSLSLLLHFLLLLADRHGCVRELEGGERASPLHVLSHFLRDPSDRRPTFPFSGCPKANANEDKHDHMLETILTYPSDQMEPPTVSTDSIEGDPKYIAPMFPIGPFTKYSGNPILVPDKKNKFESAYLYNPTAIVLDGKVFMLYRAQDDSLLSSIGLAWSTDGYHFTRRNAPILTATEPWEKGGGTEDPRIIRVDGVFYMTYTAYDTVTARLCLATSTDLIHWKRYPPMFPEWVDVVTDLAGNAVTRHNSSKAGAMFPEKGKDGKYAMIWGEGSFQKATSSDLINWTSLPYNECFARGVHFWEDRLIEPGHAPIKTRNGKWILIYNGATTGRGIYPKNQYSVGQMLIDYDHLDKGPVARLEAPLLVPSAPNEEIGQVNQVVFAEGLVQFKEKWFLYFGQSDSELGVATADVQSL